MLNIQKFLKTHSLQELEDEFGIKSYKHPSLPLVGLKYSQIDSPRAHPIVMECRGVVLEEATWKVVAKPFNRFFNVGEFHEEFTQFDWSQFTVTDKADGSLAILYCYDGSWHMNTSGSFGLQHIENYKFSWRDLFKQTIEEQSPNFYEILRGSFRDRAFSDYTLMFELCTPYNKIVQRHTRAHALLLGATLNEGGTWVDAGEDHVDEIAQILGVKRPNRHVLHSHEDIETFLMHQSEDDPTYEGVILRDATTRWKWKTKTYTALHHLKDNGNILKPKRLLPLVLAGETDETLAYLPEITSAVQTVGRIVTQAFREILELWENYGTLEKQKDFALNIKHHRLAPILFEFRKNGGGTPKDLFEAFKRKDILLLRAYFDKVSYHFDHVSEKDGQIIIDSKNE